jgi:hypothetical protein
MFVKTFAKIILKELSKILLFIVLLSRLYIHSPKTLTQVCARFLYQRATREKSLFVSVRVKLPSNSNWQSLQSPSLLFWLYSSQRTLAVSLCEVSKPFSDSWQESVNVGSAPRKASTYTEQGIKRRGQTLCLELDWSPRSQLPSDQDPCLRPRGHWHWQQSRYWPRIQNISSKCSSQWLNNDTAIMLGTGHCLICKYKRRFGSQL